MSNNDDNDMDVENFDDGGFDDFSKKNSLGDMWKNNPMVKIGVILAGLAVVGGALAFVTSQASGHSGCRGTLLTPCAGVFHTTLYCSGAISCTFNSEGAKRWAWTPCTRQQPSTRPNRICKRFIA